MAEEFDIGSSGIDTQYERDQINYRPKIEYKPPLIDSTYGLSVDTASQDTPMTELGNSLSTASLWEDVVGVIQNINKVEATLSDKLKDVSTPIPAKTKQAIINAAEKLGYSGITDSIPFDLYKKSFDTPDAPESYVIQNAFESYMSDVDGNLNGELYGDVIEIKNDWTDVLDFMKKGLFSQIVPLDQVPKDLSTDNAQIEIIHQKEQEMLAEYSQLLKLRAVDKQICDQLYNTEYGSERYFQSVKDLEYVKRKIVNIEKRLFTKAEIVDLISRKASDTDEIVGLISNSIDYDPYEDDKYQILYSLLKQFKTRDSMKTGLKKMQAVLKLSIDGKNHNVNATKNNLRGIAGRTSKKRINDTLVNGVHLRNEIFGDVYDIMNNLDGAPDNDNFDVVATHIMDGIQQAELMYQGQASDFYKIHVMDNELRTNKLTAIINKDAARSTYKLIGSVLDYSTNVNNTWPSEDQMSAWLNSFMEHSQIK